MNNEDGSGSSAAASAGAVTAKSSGGTTTTTSSGGATSPTISTPFQSALATLVNNATFRKNVMKNPKLFMARFPNLNVAEIAVLIQVGEGAGYRLPPGPTGGVNCCCCCCCA